MKELKFSQCSAKEKKLINEAIKAREHACAPYSNFKVGAAALSKKGKIFHGCNIESADYTLTTHAEMHAVNCMVFAGEVPLSMIAVALKCDQGYPTPCGLCRQKLREFSIPNAIVLSVNIDENKKVKKVYKTTLIEMLPYSFGRENLDK
ncbi:MAG TPA: cytidine deaminase [bacterium]|nr:cytidine deaminase [bacterium]HPN30533.1 cytidine deaminase [bacterium]